MVLNGRSDKRVRTQRATAAIWIEGALPNFLLYSPPPVAKAFLPGKRNNDTTQLRLKPVRVWVRKRECVRVCLSISVSRSTILPLSCGGLKSGSLGKCLQRTDAIALSSTIPRGSTMIAKTVSDTHVYKFCLPNELQMYDDTHDVQSIFYMLDWQCALWPNLLFFLLICSLSSEDSWCMNKYIYLQ